MNLAGIAAIATSPRGKLTMLFVAAVAVVIALSTSAIDGQGQSALTLPLPVVLFAAIAVGLTALAFAIMLHAATERRPTPTDNRGDAADLRKTLAVTEAILKAEQQVLVFWEQGQRVRVVTHTLTGVPGVPEDAQTLECFGAWLNPTSAAELKICLDALFAEGRAFNILVQTTQNAYVEADGRAAGGRAILRLRDVVGYKRDLARILEQHRHLTREFRRQSLAARCAPDAGLAPQRRGADGVGQCSLHQGRRRRFAR